MAYAHVAHDCHVGSQNVIFANNATLAGHVEIGDSATIGAFSAVHQFCRVGEHAFIGGFTVCTQDVLPFVKTVGSRPAKTYGINTVGLERKGFSPDTIEALHRAYRILIRSKLKLQDALQKIEGELTNYPEARYLVEFVRGSQSRIHPMSIRVGVVGTGYLGRLHARVLTEMPEAEVVGFVDTNDAVASEIAATLDCRSSIRRRACSRASNARLSPRQRRRTSTSRAS